jgi:Holliday junction resolvase RusA-like endonuclease
MITISFFVAGEPKGQPRPKAFARGGHAAVYDPGTAEGWKLLVRAEADKAKPAAPFTGALSLRCEFYLKRPKGHYNSKGVLKPTAPNFHIGKPDADNFAKAVMDALTNIGTIWGDDSQVSRLYVSKMYTTTTPGCAITIAEIAT